MTKPASSSPPNLANAPLANAPGKAAAYPAIIYLVTCGFYIYVSGIIAVRIAGDAAELQRIETIKGLLFIILTSILFYVLNLRQWQKLKHLEQQIQEREAALVLTHRKATAAMSVASLAHDLNNLLQMLEGSLFELKPFIAKNPDTEVLYNGLVKNKEALCRFTRRIQQHATTSENLGSPRPLDLPTELSEILELSQRHPDIRKCQVNFEAPRTLPLQLNTSLLDEAVTNLLINAAQSTTEGKGKIKLVLFTKKEQACIEVHDNGPGVPDTERNLIFEPCYTTKPKGSGLGMLAVKAFALSCGGDVEIGDSPLGGARFTLCFPLVPAANPAIA